MKLSVSSLVFSTLAAFAFTSNPVHAQDTTPTPPATQEPIFINAGARNELVDSMGNVWMADKYYNTTNTVSWPKTKVPLGTVIANTPDPELYHTQRWAKWPRFFLQYNIPVQDGLYEVSLHFVETYFGRVGWRVFSVALEDDVVISDLDIFDEVGFQTALVKTETVVVDDGLLTIDFIGNKQNPKINAIQITPIGA